MLSHLPRPQAVDFVHQALLNRQPARVAAKAKLPPGGRFCRAVYAPLTTTGRSSARTQTQTPAPDFALLIRATQEARTMRIYGPNGTNRFLPGNPGTARFQGLGRYCLSQHAAI